MPTLIFAFNHAAVGDATVELTATQPSGAENFLLLNGFELLQAAP